MKNSRTRMVGAWGARLLLTLTALLLLGCPASKGNQSGEQSGSSTLRFKHTAIDTSPPSGSGCCLDVLAAGDLDGDGKPDLLLGSEHAAGLFWYQSPTWKRHVIGPGNFTTDGRIADLNGDRRMDLIVSGYTTIGTAEWIEWWENLGNPTRPEGWRHHRIARFFAHDLVVGDVNGDGRPDVVVFRKEAPNRGVFWFENPVDPTRPWIQHVIAANLAGEGLVMGDTTGTGRLDVVASHHLFQNDGRGAFRQVDLGSICASGSGGDIRPAVADINGDGRADIVLGAAEGCLGPVVWLEGPDFKTRHVVSPDNLKGNHTLEVADFDADRRPDILVGEMHSGGRRVIVYQNLGTDTWAASVLSRSGTHNARIADLDGDGRPDIVGKNYDGPKAVEAWINISPKTLSLHRWRYVSIDNARERFHGEVAFFGVAFADVNRDGYADIVSGKYFYRNPGGDMTDPWKRVTFPVNADGMLAVDVDDDGQPDVIAQALPKVYWLKPDAQGERWSAREVAQLPPTEHTNSQGYALGQLVAGSRPQIVFTTGRGLWYVRIPDNPAAAAWPAVQITSEPTSEDLLAVGDIDQDGRVDVVGAITGKGKDDLYWFENPPNPSGDWTKHVIGRIDSWADRAALADINGDGRLDLVVSQENGRPDGSATYWFERPADPRQRWTQHTVATQGSTNSMSVGDLNGDGLPDIVTGEHKGTLRVVIWENRDRGAKWVSHRVDQGKESHLGVRLYDLSGKGAMDIVSIAWDNYRQLHLWRNDARRR